MSGFVFQQLIEMISGSEQKSAQFDGAVEFDELVNGNPFRGKDVATDKLVMTNFEVFAEEEQSHGRHFAGVVNERRGALHFEVVN